MHLDDLPRPRLCATPLGADHSRAVVDGVRARLAGQPPEAAGRVTVFANSARMRRRLADLWAADGATIVPRIRLVTELGTGPEAAHLPPAIPPVAHLLTLGQLVAALIARRPDLAQGTARFALTESLAELLAEMQEEAVGPDRVAALDVGPHAEHFQRLRDFLGIVAPHFADPATMTPARRLRLAIDGLALHWATSPPDDPVIVAGSTGSRGATFALIAAIARLPRGVAIVPGADCDMPPAIWRAVLGRRARPGGTGDPVADTDADRGPDPDDGHEDHPQYRIGRLAQALGVPPWELPVWGAARAAVPARNALVSLALRPAPVTDQWRTEGPALDGIEDATRDVTLLEAPGPQAEAAAIALRLRRAAETGQRAALISPDRMLTRQVTAALDRWGIEPDDSAGRPLAMSPPGRLLRHLAQAMGRPMDAETMAVLLKHPLAHTGHDRGPHLMRAEALETRYLRREAPFPTRAGLARWADGGDAATRDWAAWVADTLLPLGTLVQGPLAGFVQRLQAAAEALCAGPARSGAGDLWDAEAGRAALDLVSDLSRHADAGGALSAAEFGDLMAGLMAGIDVRNPVTPHPGIMIWGPVEARVQGADLVILGGLNDATWPGAPPADPWLNRALRAAAGLRRPDRGIGLAAHDVQQAMAAPELWLTRALRDAETATVPSRWLNRLTNLMGGAGPATRDALAAMRGRGAGWLALAGALGRPDAVLAADAGLCPAPRPAPVPPLSHRPDVLSVTRVETLIRDPYAIYADTILRLRPHEPLRKTPDAPLRGTILHLVLNRFVAETRDGLPGDAEARLLQIADAVLEAEAPWPAARRLWRARLAEVAGWFVAGERERRAGAEPAALEVRGTWPLDLGVTLTGTADRIDRAGDGSLHLYDYKTGRPPSDKQERSFNRQLWLEALMAEAGAFEGLAPAPVSRIAYIGLGGGGDVRAQVPDRPALREIRAGLDDLVGRMLDPAHGFAARLAPFSESAVGDYDQMARHGEWSDTDPPVKIEVGR